MEVLTTAETIRRHGRPAVRHRISRGIWQRPARGVIVLHNGPLSDAEREVVAIAASPSGTALGGLSSLKAAGLTGFEPSRTFLVLPNGARRPQVPAIECHQSIHLGPDDVDRRAPVPRTTNARSVIDAAAWVSSDRLARAIVIASFQQGLVSTRQVREAIVRRPTQLRRGLVVESVLDVAGGVQSLPERDFEEIRVLAGLSAPTRQRPVRGRDGRYFLDVWFELEQLGVEIHGIPHLAVKRWDSDLRRANEIVLRGERLLTFSSYAIRREREAVIDQLRRAVGRDGVHAVRATRATRTA